MKKALLDRYNLALILLAAVFLWSLAAFFTYHVAPLPERMPDGFSALLDRELRPGEPVYLTDQRFDAFVWGHPQYNIFPGGGRNAAKAARAHRFFLVGDVALPDEFGELKEFSSAIVARDGALALHLFTRRDGAASEYRLSDAFPEGLTARSSAFPEGASFGNGEFTVGHASWERVQVKTGEFGPEKRTALSVHPLSGADQWVELTVDPARWHAAALAFGYGIASSGDCKGGCPPVTVTVSQGDRVRSFMTEDNAWRQAELTGFAPDRPLTVRAVVEKAGKRHFYCDLFLVTPGTGGTP